MYLGKIEIDRWTISEFLKRDFETLTEAEQEEIQALLKKMNGCADILKEEMIRVVDEVTELLKKVQEHEEAVLAAHKEEQPKQEQI